MPAPTALTLMRSRYSAYRLKEASYIAETSLHGEDPAAIAASMEKTHFYRLEILSFKRGGVLDKRGEVTFRAFYEAESEKGTRKGVLEERSVFIRRKGRWYYDEGASEWL